MFIGPRFLRGRIPLLLISALVISSCDQQQTSSYSYKSSYTPSYSSGSYEQKEKLSYEPWEENNVRGYQPRYQTTAHWIVQLDWFYNVENPPYGYQQSDDADIRLARAYRSLDLFIDAAKDKISLAEYDLNKKEDAILILNKIGEVIDSFHSAYRVTKRLSHALQPWKDEYEGTVFRMDCDTSAYIYLAIAEVLGLPMSYIYGDRSSNSSHAIIAWKTNSGKLYWETNATELPYSGKMYYGKTGRIADITTFISINEVELDQLAITYFNEIAGNFFQGNQLEIPSFHQLDVDFMNRYVKLMSSANIPRDILDDSIAFREFLEIVRDEQYRHRYTGWMASENPAIFYRDIAFIIKSRIKPEVEQLKELERRYNAIISKNQGVWRWHYLVKRICYESFASVISVYEGKKPSDTPLLNKLGLNFN